jgi:hypothetical protein
MRWIVSLTFLLTATMCLLISQTLAASGQPRQGGVGGRPTMRLPEPEIGKKITPALVLGRGSLAGDKFELAAAGWRPPGETEDPKKIELCVWIENLSGRAVSSSCGAVAQLAMKIKSMCVQHFTESIFSAKSRMTEIDGLLSENAQHMKVTFSRPGSRHRFHLHLLVADVGGDLQNELKQSNSFGYFVARVHGRIQTKSFEAHVWGGSGDLLGTTNGISDICQI